MFARFTTQAKTIRLQPFESTSRSCAECLFHNMSKFGAHPDLNQCEETIGLLCFDTGARSSVDTVIEAGRSAVKGATKVASDLASELLSAGYGYRVLGQVVVGLTPESALQPSEAVQTALKKAVSLLEEAGAIGICGESALMLPLQPLVRSLSKKPVFLSSLLQASLLVPAHDLHQKFAIITRHAEKFNDEAQFKLVLSECGIEIDSGRFTVLGIRSEETGKQVSQKVLGMKASMPELSGIICDCVELIPFADEIRAVTKFPVFDQVTLMDFFHSARSDNIYFGTSYQHLQQGAISSSITKAQRRIFSPYDGYIKSLTSGVDKNAAIGVLRIDYSYPPIPGDVDHVASYGYKVKFSMVQGLTFEKAQQAVLDDAIQESFRQAVQQLESQGVIAITGDCGFMMAFQPFVRSLTDLPVLLSSIIQAPMLVAAHAPQAKFAVFTANSTTFDKDRLLAQSGISVPPEQWIVVGLQDLPGFEAVAIGGLVPAEVVQPGIIARARDLVAREPNLKAILLECTELPHYADALRAATGLPVFDAITAVDYFQSSCTMEPGFSKRVLESILGILDPRVVASGIAVITAGTLGKVAAFSGQALKAGIDMVGVVPPLAPAVGKPKKSCCCTTM